ncbi:uncharacterized protein LOC121694797 isoform X2 [Alosa sapidissima]|uniref:uncharacterized protein LOC121694797 isoform X2 n=1 Tax=Alosa sapidissima TaxID=34773 RepID=UPI001C088D46|nr:uncharacterized protein LOC121694797 isoform X2 [Alosa sapidissima]
MAGLGETCSHVGAVLFKLEACVRLGYNKVACTSVACAWNGVSTKTIEPAMIKDIEFYSEQAKKKRNVKKRRPIPKASAAQQNQFLQMLCNTKELPIGLSSFKSYADVFAPIPWYNNLEGFTEEQCSFVEEETKGQAACKAWHRHRVGRITGSTAHRVLHTSLDRPSKALINDICSCSSIVLGVPSLQWGKDHEVDAINTYKYVLGLCSATPNTSPCIIVSEDISKPHNNLKVDTAGFRISQERPYIGVSCDGYVSCECCGNGVVEAKCPFKWANEGSTNWTEGHLDTLISLKKIIHTIHRSRCRCSPAMQNMQIL